VDKSRLPIAHESLCILLDEEDAKNAGVDILLGDKCEDEFRSEAETLPDQPGVPADIPWQNASAVPITSLHNNLSPKRVVYERVTINTYPSQIPSLVTSLLKSDTRSHCEGKPPGTQLTSERIDDGPPTNAVRRKDVSMSREKRGPDVVEEADRKRARWS
jgi:hypothetical protein